MNLKDLSGTTVGKLTILGRAPSRTGHTYYSCSCSCSPDKKFEVARANLTSSPPRKASCGCKLDYMKRDSLLYMRNRRYGFLTAVLYVPKSHQTGQVGPAYWECSCTCGTICKASTTALKTGKAISCKGCRPEALKLEQENTLTGIEEQERFGIRRQHITRMRYDNMLNRCRHNPRYADKVCRRWLEPNKKGFRNFVQDMGLCPHSGMTLDRLDVLGKYEKSNCRWATDSEQRRNKTTSRVYMLPNGYRVNQCDLAMQVGLTDRQLSRKIERFGDDGWSETEAVERILADIWIPAQCAI